MEEMRTVPIKGFDRYKVTKDGKVYATHLSRFLKDADNGTGYRQHKLRNIEGKRKAFYTHRLVAMCWVDNPENLLEVNHIDLNKSNNHADNLEWVSRSGNLKHAYLNGAVRGHMGCTCGTCKRCIMRGDQEIGQDS